MKTNFIAANEVGLNLFDWFVQFQLIDWMFSEYYNSKLIEQLADNISKIVKLTQN